MRKVWTRAVQLLCVGALLLTGVSHAAERLTPLTAADLSAELAQARGEVVLVNFWATWCRPCLEEIPLLMQLADEHGAAGFRLLPVSLDEYAALDTQVRPFVAKWFPNFRSFISVEYTMDDMVSAIDPNWNEVLPTSYLVAPDGSVAEILQGKYTKEQFAERITGLLASAAPRDTKLR